MEPFAGYLLRSAVWLTGFSMIYFLFLRNERFFRIKRFYLVTGVVASLIFPLIAFHYKVEMPAPPAIIPDLGPLAIQASPVSQPFPERSLADYRNVLLFLYITGIVFLAVRMIKHMKALSGIIRKSQISSRGKVRIVKTPGIPSSFSFFNYVFISPAVMEAEAEQILNHEEVHVEQKHWFDLILAELIRMIQWANPFAWIYAGFIRQNHEYLADEAALGRAKNPADYRATLLNQIFNAPVICLSNSFSYSINKKRFDMMKNVITSPYRKLKILLILPVFAIIFYAFATPEYNYAASAAINPIPQGTIKGTVLNDANKPMFGVAIGVTGKSTKVFTSEKGYFEIPKVVEGSSLVITYSGYETLTVKPDFKKEMIIKMVKETATEETNIRLVADHTMPEGLDLPPKPLILIDGVESLKGFSDINPNSINTISVLKDKSATAVFGEKGKNGVVIVTTKNAGAVKQLEPATAQNSVKGIVVKEDGTAFPGVTVVVSDKPIGAITDAQGRFILGNVPADATLLFSFKGYKQQTLKSTFSSEMNVKMEIDPDYKAPAPRPDPLVVIDDVISTKPRGEAMNEIRDQIGTMKVLTLEEAGKKYGEKGKNGAVEIMTISKAKELGIKIPFRRRNPEDFPTFQGNNFGSFTDWVAGQIKYPPESVAKGSQGYATVDYTIEPDGTVTNVKSLSVPDPTIGEALVKVIQSSPKWEPAKNPEANEPFNGKVTLNFELPDRVTTENIPFVVVEQMPRFPGGEAALLTYIGDNTQYPDSAKAKNIQGKVIVRFAISKEGKVGAVSVLKGVHPLLDEEAVRIVKGLPAFIPGYQGGAPVSVWYMVPITFTLK